MFNWKTAIGGSPLPRLAPDDPKYPYGLAKNDDPPGSNTGTPIGVETLADSMYAMWAVLLKAGIVPNGVQEEVDGNSQFVTALENLFFKVGDFKPSYNDQGDAWLLCDGSTFVSGDYPELALLLGTTTLPNLKGRVLVGRDASDPDFNTLGEQGGSKTHTLQIGEIPAHTHSVEEGVAGSGNDFFAFDSATGLPNYSTGSAGGGGSHNNVQPYSVVNWYIKGK